MRKALIALLVMGMPLGVVAGWLWLQGSEMRSELLAVLPPELGTIAAVADLSPDQEDLLVATWMEEERGSSSLWLCHLANGGVRGVGQVRGRGFSPDRRWFSADGKLIISGGGDALFWMDLQGQPQRPLLTVPPNEMVWLMGLSPQRDLIAFWRVEMPNDPSLLGGSGALYAAPSALWVMNADGSNARRVWSFDGERQTPMRPLCQWLPDGQRIGCPIATNDESLLPGTYLYKTVEVESGRQEEVAPVWTAGVWTPECDEFISVRTRGIIAYEGDGTGSRELVPLPQLWTGASRRLEAWARVVGISPDGGSIAYLFTEPRRGSMPNPVSPVASAPGRSELWLASRDGTRRRLLYTDYFSSCRWSPDGKRFYYTRALEVRAVEVE